MPLELGEVRKWEKLIAMEREPCDPDWEMFWLDHLLHFLGVDTELGVIICVYNFVSTKADINDINREVYSSAIMRSFLSRRSVFIIKYGSQFDIENA